ncbi:endonuclease MutS2 [Helicobacter jaachi]|uniref:Endonuclease MutS2 n=1 Tax=Helicobacter jaachi TaxID=1677920 RepID=A0A4U8TCE3_9HELI|nr:endonuclease MutS2 [Helicobacter jaachi]TLD97640.1 endonuclease MutS2 [Helicobacter jaachi]
MHYENLISRLDIYDFLAHFGSYFAREKSFVFEGDRQFYATLLQELDKGLNIELAPPPLLPKLDTPLVHLQKYGTLRLEEIFAFVQLVDYFCYLKRTLLESTPRAQAWLDKIIIPKALDEMRAIFDSNGQIKDGIYAQLDSLKLRIKQNKIQIDEQISRLLHTNALAPYLVDNNLHYINQNECLLLKAGYNHAIKGMVLERSNSGFFYLMPDSIIALKKEQNTLKDTLELSLYDICKDFSQMLKKHHAFLKFLNMAFDTFDHIYARLSFARANNLSFIYQMEHKQKDIILHEFSHPALQNPKPLSIAFKGDVLMITGVNAGGKTMLLKSILSACFLSKFLLPLKINPHHSQIPYFKHIVAIISDPQNSKNDISTFAGRMLEFSRILNTQNLLLGIDEIELGTDADEAASLYKVLLEHLLQNQAKVLLTTHHKHLSALMASNPRVQLCAAMYDIQAQKPLFSFLDGSIGKSYAFESAQIYGIPSSLIAQAKAAYGADKERLNELIERSSELELSLQAKQKELQASIASYEQKLEGLKAQEYAQKRAFEELKHNLESTYHKATQALKSALKTQDSKQMHKAFNNAHHILAQTPNPTPPKPPKKLKVGDRVKYKNTKGRILSINGNMGVVELDSGFKLKEKLEHLSFSSAPIITPKTPQIKVTHNKSAHIKLDLHGMRGEEAIEKLDEFLSSALIAGYDEVLVYHGIGSGILSKLVRDFLSTHPKILSFEDAPANMGGFGAKIIKL